MSIKSELLSFALPLDDAAWAKLEKFNDFLLAKNERMDLTNVPEADMAIRHYADSLLVLKHDLLKPGFRVIDVGSGAGFPGLALAVARPDIDVTLLESMRKRCDFLEEAIKLLALPNARVVMGRAEDLAHTDLRESYDLALARAVATLPVLAEYLLPFLKVGGMALCWKGPAVLHETSAGERASRQLGGQLCKLIDLRIPGRSHFVQALLKVSPTHAKYPRKAGIPAKTPLA